MTTIVLLLVASVVVYVMLSRWSRRERAAIGLADETVESTDDVGASMSTLRSARYGLVGRPDQLVRVGRMLIPVEQKPRARRLQPSHVLQVAAQCLLVQDVYGVRPAFGLVILAGGERHQVEFSPALEQRLLATMAQMRALLGAGKVPEPYWIAAKCRACGFRQTCWQRTRSNRAIHRFRSGLTRCAPVVVRIPAANNHQPPVTAALIWHQGVHHSGT